MRNRMMLNLITLFTLLLSFNSSACWVSASQQVSVQDDTLTVIQTANFCLGSGSTCPHIEYYTYSINGNQICFDVFYNLNVTMPTFQCTSIDTIRVEVPYGIYDVCLNSNTISGNDTNLVETGIQYGVMVSLTDLNLNQSIQIYPNPTRGKAYISGDVEIDEVIITDITGRQIRKQEYSSELDLESLNGVVLIHLLSDGKVIACRRVAIE